MTAEAHAELHDRAPAGEELAGHAAPDWADRIERHVEDVEALLASELEDLITSWDLGTPGPGISYSAHLPMQLRELINRGGKRVRPIMTLIGWVAGDVRQERRGYDDMMRAACAIEMLHCFALVHDDVMDESSTPTRAAHRAPPRRTAAQRAQCPRRRASGSARASRSSSATSRTPRPTASRPRCRADARDVAAAGARADRRPDLRPRRHRAVADRRVEFARSVARKKSGCYTVARPLQLGAAAAQADPRRWPPSTLRPARRRGVRAARRPARRVGRPG